MAMLQYGRRVRQRKRWLRRSLAGVPGHDGANQCHGWVRNSIAHLMVVLSTADPGRTGGEPEMGGAKASAKTQMR